MMWSYENAPSGAIFSRTANFKVASIAPLVSMIQSFVTGAYAARSQKVIHYLIILFIVLGNAAFLYNRKRGK